MLLNSSDCMWLCGMLAFCIIQYIHRFVCRAAACSCALPACLYTKGHDMRNVAFNCMLILRTGSATVLHH